MKVRFLIVFVVCCCSYFSKAQKKENLPAPAPSVNPVVAPVNKASGSGPRPYSEVITNKAIVNTGLFTVDKLDDKVFFEIPDSLAGRDVLIQTRLSKAGADMRSSGGGYAGDEIGTTVVRFEKTSTNKIFIRKISFAERSMDSTQPMYMAVTNSTIQPIVMSFDIKAIKTDSISKQENWVIDVTEIINGDNDLFWGNKGGLGLAGYQSDKSYMVSVKTFPFNTEIKAIKTYMRTPRPGGQGMPAMGAPPQVQPVTIELNSSLVLLPEKAMQPRYADERVGYFSHSYTDFDANPQGVKNLQMIARWRLEPKEEDIEKYKRGELVEPQKPIVIYIDPATPAKWIPYLIQGINDWQTAFEQAGFKNAIRGERAPTPQEDSTWSLDDARHSAIVYKPSTIPNASGPHTSDPRSGEIIETHINWYHNVMKLLQTWYMIQTSAVDIGARAMQFDDELMGNLIRFVSSHEVGHTLGLQHNFGSSSTTPVEKLRDKNWVEANGHTPSIMDYARFNYVAQPEDNINRAGLYPRIGVYDKWAIEWGYRWIPQAKTAEQEISILNKWIIEKSGDRRYWFANGNDARALTEDLGDNAMKASAYGIKNLKRILPNLRNWTQDPNGQYENLNILYKELVATYGRYLGHVCANIGGQYRNLKSEQETGPVFEAAPVSLQKQAVVFLDQNFFITPTWIIDTSILAVIGQSPLSVISGLQNGILSGILSSNTFKDFLENETMDGKTYKLLDYMKDMQNIIWKELLTKKSIDIYRRNLQKLYVQRLIGMIIPQGVSNNSGMQVAVGAPFTDEAAVAKAELVSLRSKIRTAMPSFTDAMSRYHLQDMEDRIGIALDPK